MPCIVFLSFFLSFFGLFLSSLFVFVSTVSFGSETVTKRNKALTNAIYESKETAVAFMSALNDE